MVPIKIPFLLFLLIVQFTIGEDNTGCGSLTVKLDKKNYTLTLPVGAFKDTTDCVIEVTSYKDMEFSTTIPEIKFYDNGECVYNYVALSVKKEELANKPIAKLCEQEKATAAQIPQTKTLYIKIVTKKITPDMPTVTFNFQSIQGKECGLPEIQLTNSIEKIQFPPEGQPFTTQTECDITVKGLKDRDFQMTIPEMKFDCSYGYVAADSNQAGLTDPKYKKCGTSSVTEAIISKSGTLYLKILTNNAAPKFTLQFETIYSECGSSQIELNVDTDLVLPKTGQTFKADTDCKIKVSGMNGRNFAMTISKIKFPDTCNTDYVAASATENGLTTTDYKKCGTTAVTDPISAQNGTMYLQIKTPNAKAETAVTLHFKGGAGERGHLPLEIFLIFNLASTVLFFN